MRKFSQTVLVVAALPLVSGCSSAGRYVWVDDLKEPVAATEQEYVIAAGDVLNVRVYNQESVSGKVRVRSDGKVSLPLVDEVEAAGLTPAALGRRLQSRLKAFINNPVVTVSLEEPGAIQVSVLGEVGKPGAYLVQPGASVLQVLATAGGLTPFASRDRIFLVRKNPPGHDPPLLRVRFSYGKLARAEGLAAVFRMRDGDALVVE